MKENESVLKDNFFLKQFPGKIINFETFENLKILQTCKMKTDLFTRTLCMWWDFRSGSSVFNRSEEWVYGMNGKVINLGL